MAQAGYTPIQLYFSTTAAAVPTAGNLANGELGINIQDEKLYFKNAAGTVKLLASNATSAPVLTFSAGTTGFTPSTATTGAVTLAGTLAVANGGTGVTTSTGTTNVVLSNSPTLVTPTLGVATATSLQGIIGNVNPAAGSFTTVTASTAIGTASGGTGLGGATPFTANGVVYASSTSVLTTGSALTFDGNNFTQSGTNASTQLLVNTANAGVSASNYSEIVLADVGVGRTFWRNLRDGSGATIFSGNDHIRYALLGSEQMRLTSTGLGIGTNSPAYKLDVGNGSAQVVSRINSVGGNNAGPYLRFDKASVQKNLIGSVSAVISGTSDDLAYWSTTGAGHQWFVNSGGTASLTLDSSGNLGLGVTPSAWWSSSKAIQIGSTGAPYFSISQQTATTCDGYVMWGARLVGDRSFVYQTSSDPVSAYRQNGAVHAWFNAPSGTAGNPISFTQAMTLDASGRLGIGTTSPTTRLHVKAASDNADVLQIQDASEAQQIFMGVSAANGGPYLFVATNQALRFGTNNTERARISSDGTFRVKGAGTAGSTDAFQVAGGAPADAARITSGGDLLVGATTAHGFGIPSIQAGGSNGNGIMSVRRDTTSSADQVLFYNPNGNVGGISTSGSLTSYNVTSDQRLKENIQDADSASSLIDSLQVRKFDWKTDQTHQRYGFIAQELVTVAPEAVYQPEDTDKMMAVDYSKLVPMLVKEIQSLRQRLAVLEAA